MKEREKSKGRRREGEPVTAEATAILESLREKVIALGSDIMALSQDIDDVITVRVKASKGLINFYEEVENFEVGLIVWALDQSGGNQAAAARVLGLKPNTLNSLVRRYGVKMERASKRRC